MSILSQTNARDLFVRLSAAQQTAAWAHDGLYTIHIKSRLDAAVVSTHIAFTPNAMCQCCAQITPESQQIPIVQWHDIDALTGTVPGAPGPYRG